MADEAVRLMGDSRRFRLDDGDGIAALALGIMLFAAFDIATGAVIGAVIQTDPELAGPGSSSPVSDRGE